MTTQAAAFGVTVAAAVLYALVWKPAARPAKADR
jgi:hypothetical protein